MEERGAGVRKAEIHVGTVMALYSCITTGAPMQCRAAVQAIAGRGIAGDRYASNQGAYSGALRSAIRHVTLIAREAIDVSNRLLIAEGLPTFDAQEIRRNILTEGIDLKVLVGAVFAIGAIKFRGSEETIPCKRISALTHKAGFYEAFAGRGGIRAEVLISGTIKVGDPIDTIASQMSEKN